MSLSDNSSYCVSFCLATRVFWLDIMAWSIVLLMFLIALFNLMFDSYVLLLMSAHRLTHKFDQSLARKIYSLKAHRPPVSLEVWRANFSRSQKLFTFSVYTHSHTWSLPNGVDLLTRELTATSNNRNFLVEKSNYILTSRHLLRKVDGRVSILFRKIDRNWSVVEISICLHLSEWQICIF